MEGNSTNSTNTVHVLKYNAPGVWATLLVRNATPTTNTGGGGAGAGTAGGKVRALTVAVDKVTSDLCLGLVAPSVQAMNCQPGNPVAFLTLMWNVTHNRAYFLNHPLNETAPDANPGNPDAPRIKYGPHAAPVAGAKYVLEVDLESWVVKGSRDGNVYFETQPLSKRLQVSLGRSEVRLGTALSGVDERIRVTANFPVSAESVEGMNDTLAFADTAEGVKPNGQTGGAAAFAPVAVSVESLMPHFRLEERYRGAAKRRQHIDVNEAYPGCKKIHSDPDIYEVANFLRYRTDVPLSQAGAGSPDPV